MNQEKKSLYIIWGAVFIASVLGFGVYLSYIPEEQNLDIKSVNINSRSKQVDNIPDEENPFLNQQSDREKPTDVLSASMHIVSTSPYQEEKNTNQVGIKTPLDQTGMIAFGRQLISFLRSNPKMLIKKKKGVSSILVHCLKNVRRRLKYNKSIPFDLLNTIYKELDQPITGLGRLVYRLLDKLKLRKKYKVKRFEVGEIVYYKTKKGKCYKYHKRKTYKKQRISLAKFATMVLQATGNIVLHKQKQHFRANLRHRKRLFARVMAMRTAGILTVGLGVMMILSLDKDDEIEGKVISTGGMPNLGATCYLNASIQALLCFNPNIFKEIETQAKQKLKIAKRKRDNIHVALHNYQLEVCNTLLAIQYGLAFKRLKTDLVYDLTKALKRDPTQIFNNTDRKLPFGEPIWDRRLDVHQDAEEFIRVCLNNLFDIEPLIITKPTKNVTPFLQTHFEQFETAIRAEDNEQNEQNEQNKPGKLYVLPIAIKSPEEAVQNKTNMQKCINRHFEPEREVEQAENLDTYFNKIQADLTTDELDKINLYTLVTKAKEPVSETFREYLPNKCNNTDFRVLKPEDWNKMITDATGKKGLNKIKDKRDLWAKIKKDKIATENIPKKNEIIKIFTNKGFNQQEVETMLNNKTLEYSLIEQQARIQYKTSRQPVIKDIKYGKVIISLNRFEMYPDVKANAWKRRKIYTRISGTKQIELAGKKFDLVAAIMHKGEAESGHYTSIGKKDNTWYRFDDTNKPSPISGREKKDFLENAYIFFYHEKKADDNS